MNVPNYKQKLTNPLTDAEFLEGMKQGKFVRLPEHQAFIAFLHYTACRVTEALRMTRGQFRHTPTTLYCDIGARLKKRKISKSGKPLAPFITAALPLPINAPFVASIQDALIGLKPEARVWPYCRKTGYNIVHRVFKYPHYHRLSRITQFLLDGYTIPEIKSWTGLTAQAIDYYVGLVSIEKMGKTLGQKED